MFGAIVACVFFGTRKSMDYVSGAEFLGRGVFIRDEPDILQYR